MEYPVNKGAGNPVEFKGLKVAIPVRLCRRACDGAPYGSLSLPDGGGPMDMLILRNPVWQPVGVGDIPFECPLR